MKQIEDAHDNGTCFHQPCPTTRSRVTQRLHAKSLEKNTELKAALAACVLPYEALLLDKESRKWIAPEIWNEIEASVAAARKALSPRRKSLKKEL